MVKFCQAVLFFLILTTSSLANADSSEQTEDKLFAPCPNSPNCISSKSKQDGHYTKPLPLMGSAADSFQQLTTIILSYPRVKIVTQQSNYIHVTYTSLIFKFVDDVEFLLEENDKVIHMRSASRKGYYDFGVNRRRLEKISETYIGKAN